MWKCKHCKKSYKFSRATEKANHTRHCELNPNKINSESNAGKAAKEYIDTVKGKVIDFIVQCYKCDKQFSVKEREKLFPKKEKYFCSRSCANSMGGQAKNQDATNYRTICFKFHKKQCIVCGEDKIVAVHHYDENHENNSPENLVPLCPTHHQYMHSPYKKEIEQKVLDYLNDFKGP